MRSNLLVKIFSCRYMVKEKYVRGELPSTEEGYRNTLNIAWPSIVEAVLVSLVASVDTMMVGGIGPEAIAAVGITNQPRFIVLAMLLSLNVGVTAVVARRKGEGDIKAANRCLKQSILISLGLSFILSFLGITFAPQLMKFAGAQPEIINTSISYFRIIMVGLFFNGICLTINAAQRGIGNTKVSMRTNIAANIINLIFNYLLINGIAFFPTLGVVGAGIATVLGNIVAFLMALKSVYRRKSDGFLNILSNVSWNFDKKTLRSILNISSSAAAEQVFLRVGFFVYALMVAKLGTTAFATHQICMNITNLSFSVGDGFSIAASSLVGQNLGKKRPDIAMLYGSISQRIALICSTVLFFIFILGRKFLIGLFTNDPIIIAQGALILIIVAFTTHAQTSQVIISGCLRGAGDTKYVALTSLLSIGIIRPFLTWFLCFPVGLGIFGAWIALFIDQCMRLFICFMRFIGGKWTKIQI